MINTLVKNEKKQRVTVESILNDIYLLPKWEKIKSFSLLEKRFFFGIKSINVDIFRKFSSKNLLEKYSIRTEAGNVLASMDLKIYKDSVYIINLEIESQVCFEQLTEKMLQIAIEKALYNTTEKEVVINLTSGIITKKKVRKSLIASEFSAEENQTNYEIEMFGETFSIKAENNMFWTRKIKQMPILINK